VSHCVALHPTPYTGVGRPRSAVRNGATPSGTDRHAPAPFSPGAALASLATWRFNPSETPGRKLSRGVAQTGRVWHGFENIAGKFPGARGREWLRMARFSKVPAASPQPGAPGKRESAPERCKTLHPVAFARNRPFADHQAAPQPAKPGKNLQKPAKPRAQSSTTPSWRWTGVARRARRFRVSTTTANAIAK
jgi:hypothetical protein